jgi:actin beta/gamma 1
MGDDADFKPCVFIDNGSANCKAGPVGEDEENNAPSVQVRSCIGVPRCKQGLKLRISGLAENFYVGQEAQDMRGICSLKWPIERGMIKDMDGMEKVWRHLIDKELQAVIDCSDDGEDYKGAFLSESPLLPVKDRAETMSVWFESFKARNYFVAIGALLGLYATGKDDGIAVDSGDGVTHAVPVWQHYPIANAIRRMPLAGRDLTEYMERLLIESDINLTTSAERMTAMLMKGNFENMENSPDYTGCYIALDMKEELANGVEPQDFNMPDGSKVTVQDQLVRVPELMFNPSLDGHEMGGLQCTVNNSQLACPLDTRKALLGCVILMGGNTMFPGFKARLQQDIEKLGVLSEVKIIENPDREIHVFQGAFILGQNSSFSKFMISKEEFDECGDDRCVRQRLIADKCAL